jgi:hypothetical protein
MIDREKAATKNIKKVTSNYEENSIPPDRPKASNRRRAGANSHGARLLKIGTSMLWTIAVVLIVLWLLGLVTSYTMGGLIHVLLVIAILMVLVNLISGRRAL